METRMGKWSASSGPIATIRPASAFRRAVLLTVVLCAGLGLRTLDAFAQEEGEASPGPSFRVQRIELSLYGGMVGGTTYLELPILGTPLTNDTALDQILDFSGEAPSTPVEAPKKLVESGWKSGGSATFYLSPNFGMAIFGEYGKQEAVFSGRRVIDEVLQAERTEIDRTTMSTFAGGAQIVYHVGRERKYPVRPVLSLGFGGILNAFPDTDDIGALYLNYGIGMGFPIKGSWRGYVSFDSRIYTWETEEVALDSTLQFPAVTLGLTWRYVVPEDAEADSESAGEY